jgi:hypothetical protein
LRIVSREGIVKNYVRSCLGRCAQRSGEELRKAFVGDAAVHGDGLDFLCLCRFAQRGGLDGFGWRLLEDGVHVWGETVHVRSERVV